MRIWILRHGEAERETRCDSARALTARGESDAKAAGIFLAGITPASLAVFASPYKRAQQTALAAVQALSQQTITTADWLKPDTDPVAVIDALAQLPQRNSLLVSHQPLVSALAGVLIDGDNRAGPAMNTASLVELELTAVGAGCAKLISLRHAPDYRKVSI
jgi:phosphohistidine phosphatase